MEAAALTKRRGLKGGKTPSGFKRPERRRGVARPIPVATPLAPACGRLWEGTLQPEAGMRAVPIVVVGELGQHRPQVLLVNHDQVIETFGPDGSHEPLGHAGNGLPERR